MVSFDSVDHEILLGLLHARSRERRLRELLKCRGHLNRVLSRTLNEVLAAAASATLHTAYGVGKRNAHALTHREQASRERRGWARAGDVSR